MRRMHLAVKITGYVVAIFALLCAIVAISLTGRLLQWTAPAVAGNFGVTVRADEISGNVFSGLFFRNVTLALPQVEVQFSSAIVTFDMGTLIQKRVVIESAVFVSPRIAMNSAAGPPSRSKGPPPQKEEKPSWTFVVADLRILDGTLLWGPANNRRVVRDVNAKGRLDPAVASIDSLSFVFRESLLSARGAVPLNPPSAQLEVRSRGAVAGRAQLHLSRDRFWLNGDGKWRGGFVRAVASLKEEDWSGSADFRNLDLRPFAEIPAWSVPLSGKINLRGRGRSRSVSRGSVEWKVRMGQAGVISGRARIADGNVQTAASFLDRGIAAKGEGTFRLADRHMNVRGTFLTSRGGLQRWLKDISLYANTRWKVAGRWPRLQWQLDGAFEEAQHRELSVGSGRLHVEGKGPEKLFVDGIVYAENIRSGNRSIDEARLALSGNLESQGYFFNLRSGELSLTASGKGKRRGKEWEVTGRSLELNDGVVWSSTSPFILAFGPRGFLVSGFSMTDGQAVASVEAKLVDGQWKILRMKIDRFDSTPWAKAGLWPFPVDGVFSIRANLTGRLATPQGTLRAHVRSLRWKTHNLGRVVLNGESGNGLWTLAPLLWESPGGTLTVTGTLPARLPQSGIPDFDAKIESPGIQLGFLSPLVPQIDISSVRFESHLHLIRQQKTLEAHGSASLTAPDVKLFSGQVPLKDVLVVLKGTGEELSVEQLRAKSKDGYLAGRGSLRASGPNLTLITEKFPLQLERWGVNGRLSAELLYQGSWAAPSITGWAKVPEADYRPPEEKKKDKKKGQKEEPEKPPPTRTRKEPSALAADVSLRWDRNVWYKKQDTSIETRADLRLVKQTREPLQIVGTVETVRGSYVYYGREFQIEQGRLIFVGAVPPDPKLDVNALYEAAQSGTRVNLKLQGSVRQPRIDLSSEPALSQEDILAVLLFGAPLDQSGGGRKSPGQGAAVEVLSGYLLKEVRETRLFRELDIDVLRVRQTEEGEEVTVGRYLTKDLYVAYEHTTGQSGQRGLRAEYAVLPHWSLLGRTGEERYILDLLFKYDLP